MITIAQIVENLVSEDEVALEALRANILNLSAYAKQIRPTIEKKLYKNIRIGSIVTALSRLKERISQLPSLRAPVHIEDMSIKSPLCEITYEVTDGISQIVGRLSTQYSSKGFFTFTRGIGEITIIMSQTLKKIILSNIEVKPKGLYDDLSAITVRFNEREYVEVPNMIYTLVAAIAGKRINLIEVVSTFTELTFIVRQKDMKETIEILKDNFLG